MHVLLILAFIPFVIMIWLVFLGFLFQPGAKKPPKIEVLPPESHPPYWEDILWPAKSKPSASTALVRSKGYRLD
jgi:hypothetical protein